MTKFIAVLTLLTALACKAEEQGSAFDRATEASYLAKLKEAARLYAEAASTETDPVRRAKAEMKAANLEWRMMRNFDSARARLQRVAAGQHEAFEAKLELARIAVEQKDFATARAHVREALAMAKTRRERTLGTIAMARIDVETKTATPQTVESLRAVVAEQGPRLDTARLLMKAALLTGNGAAAMEAVDGYYHVSKFNGPPNAIASAHAALTRVLPSWKGTDAERPAIVQGLGGMRFFAEAALVGRDPSNEILRYAAAVERIEDLTNEYYRQLANEDADDDDLRDGVERELKPLGGKKEVAKRFGAYFIIGQTGNSVDLHYGHIAGDRNLPVAQYGRTASLRFIELDSMVSNGYGTWMTDGSGGDGGWATDKEIYQVRPAYANGPLNAWQYYVDEEIRQREDRETAEETARDRERARRRAIGEFPGLTRRLTRQYQDGVMAELRAKGLEGDALRDAFLARIEGDAFDSSIVLHEGRHAIDKLSKKKFKTWQLEYNAKLSEIALARAPRAALQSILDNTIGGDSPHGEANEKLANGLVAWMQAHKAEIAGLDPGLPMLPQVDKLTDEQIRVAVRGLDPLASRKVAESQSLKGDARLESLRL